MSEITDLLDKAEEGAFVYIPERICKILRLLDAKVEALEERWPQAIGELSIWKHMDERVSALDNKMDSLLKLDPYRISGISKPTLAPPEPPPKQEREPAGHAVWAPPAKGSSNYPLFEHMSRAHGLTLLESELDEIVMVVHEMTGGPKREPEPAPPEQRTPEPGSGTQPPAAAPEAGDVFAQFDQWVYGKLFLTHEKDCAREGYRAGYRAAQQASAAELERLRDLMRWRNAEKEKPGGAGAYLTLCEWSRGELGRAVHNWDGRWFGQSIRYWTEIPPLHPVPKETT